MFCRTELITSPVTNNIDIKYLSYIQVIVYPYYYSNFASISYDITYYLKALYESFYITSYLLQHLTDNFPCYQKCRYEISIIYTSDNLLSLLFKSR